MGRLGSWFKAGKAVVETYSHQRTLLSGHKVIAFLQSEHPLELAPKTIELRDILRYIAPDLNAERLEGRLNELCKSNKGKSFSTIFEERWSKTQPARLPHAEVALFEYFWLKDLPIWGPSKYIGCSKHSCYCCDLYIKLISGGEHHRPCHGNAWVHWKFPATIDFPKGAKQMLQASVRERLLESIRQECILRIMRGGQWGGRKPDSTTGMSS